MPTNRNSKLNPLKVDPGEASARAERYETLNADSVAASTGQPGLDFKARVRAAMARSTASRTDLDL
jgi:hypothetical protein